MFERLQRWLHRRDLRNRISKHGWTAVYVGDYESAPTWTYSIGFDETLNQPEVVIFDVRREDANALMWGTFEALKDGSLVLEDGRDWTDGSQGRCVWRKVHPSQIDGPDGWLAFANLRREVQTGRRFGLEGFQLVLSDPQGVMPWDDGYDESLRPRQPALWLPGDESAEAWARIPEEREARRLLRERGGWTTVPIEGPELGWAYTIGLHETLGTPDVISFAPDAGAVSQMLVDVRAALRDGSLVLSDGLRWDALGFEACFRRVCETQYLGFNWFYLAKKIREERTGGRDATPAFQLFAADENGRYPWEPGCAPQYARLQPQLFLSLEEEPHTRRVLAATKRL